MNDQNIRAHAQREFEITSAEFDKSQPQTSLISFYRRLDSLNEAVISKSATKPACRAGCSYCCYYKVEVQAIEVLSIQSFVLSRFKPEQIKEVMSQAARNVDEAKDLTQAEQIAINQKCPFLLKDECSIYPVRPSRCRNFHATDVQGCKDSFEDPNFDPPNSYVSELFEVANGSAMGFEQALDSVGIDSRIYDLNSAFLEAMKNSALGKRLKSGKKVFLSAKVV